MGPFSEAGLRPRALTVAGSDPTGGAGVQQDLKTFFACGVWGLSAVTAVTVQTTTGVERWQAVAADLVRAQLDAVLADVGADAVKTGMLATGAIVEAVAATLVDHRVGILVVDPVLVATSGDALVEDDVVEAVKAVLLPRALLVTPNAAEASALSGIEVRDTESALEAARAIRSLGPRAVLVTGGHLPTDRVVRELLVADPSLVGADGAAEDRAGRLWWREGPYLRVGPAHGTGCMLSAAITARLAQGWTLTGAVESAAAMVQDALRRASTLGGGSALLEPKRDEPSPY